MGSALQVGAVSGEVLIKEGVQDRKGSYFSRVCLPAVSHGLNSLYTALRVWGLGLIARGVSALKGYQAIMLESFRLVHGSRCLGFNWEVHRSCFEFELWVGVCLLY